MPTPKGDPDGLISRMVRFVRNSASGWHETDMVEHDPESGYSRQMLKEMIERKRRNDFVRKREFDMLRKLRRNEGVGAAELAARPSFFQSSLPSRPDDRASTLKKIDEIEAQMSQQWWKAKGSGGPTQAGSTMNMGVISDAHTRPSDLVPPDSLSSALAGLSTTVPAGLTVQPAEAASEAAAAPPVPAPSSISFSHSKEAAVHVAELDHDAELEEAAIRFANGDDAGAEVALLALLAPGHPRANEEATWLALFDLYRATAQQGRYEDYAIEFANRFGRSAPQWRGLSQAAPLPPSIRPPAVDPVIHWASPATLDRHAVAALQAAVERLAPPWRLGWEALSRVEADGAEPLLRLLAQWSAQPVEIRCLASDQFEHVLAQHTPSGDRTADPLWWKLRLEALRLLNRADEFELVALDYCVTYEVSPPSWEPPLARCQALAADGSASGGSTVAASAWGDSALPAADGGAFAPAVAHLSGDVLGDASPALHHMRQRLEGASAVVVACDDLARIDFTAASALLNWAVACSEQGGQVSFTGVHRLVAAFFGVIGLGAHARIALRHD